MPVYKVNKIVFLDKFTKCYKNIFTISNPPNDISLNNITQNISQNKLSPFQTFSSCCDNPSCVKAFIDAIRKGQVSPIPYSELIEASKISIKIANSIQ